MIYLCHDGASPARARAFLQKTGWPSEGRGVRWLFLGRDYDRAAAWGAGLGPGFERINYAQQLPVVAQQLRRPYLDWIAALGQRHNNLAWWSSRVAERNTMGDSLYHKICYLTIALSHVRGDTPVLVVAESRAVLRSIAREPDLRRRCRWVEKPRPVRERLAWMARLFRASAGELRDGIGAMADARATRGALPVLPAPTAKPRVLIHSCIDDSYFGPDGLARDRYFTVLPDELRSRGYDVVTMPWLCNLRRSRREAFAWFRQHPERYLIPEDFYTVGDYLWAAGVVIRQAGLLPGSHHFAGLDVTGLVREACAAQSLEGGGKFIRYVRLIRTWRQRGLKIDIFIDMFENMIAEKPQVLGFRQHMPDVMTVGFQHYVAPYPLCLCFFTTPAESAIAPHPDVIVCNSPWTARLFAAEGFPEEKLRVGPSLRYLHGQPELTQKPESDVVLVVIPMEQRVASELVDRLFQAFPSAEGIRFLLKIHPMMPQSEWQSSLRGRALPGHMEKVGGALAEFLARASCAVVAASTSALEMALAGVPVVLLGHETDFDMNPLAWFPEFPEPVRTAEELRARVLQSRALSDAERRQLQQWAQRQRQECYSPVTETTIGAFVRPPASRAKPGA